MAGEPVSLSDSLDMVNIANNHLPRIFCFALLVFTTMAANGGAIVESDPEKWLTEAEAAYDRVESYTAIFHKQQRISGKLLPEENIFLKCRKEPFSLYMKWVTKPFKGSELLYVVGWNEDRVRAQYMNIIGDDMAHIHEERTNNHRQCEMTYPMFVTIRHAEHLPAVDNEE